MKNKRITHAMQHSNILGAGAAKRKSLPAKEKREVVMKEFQRGTLNSGSGKKVTNPKQAMAIAYSESEKRKDIRPTNTYKSTIQSYGLSSLKNNNGAVTSPQQAKEIASQRSGQSYNQQVKNKSDYDRYGVRNGKEKAFF